MARRAPSSTSPSRRPRTPRSPAASAYLEPLARILAAGGHAPEELLRQFTAICARLPKARDPATPDRSLIDLPHVLSLWHADPAYLDASGQPKALRLTGPDSLATLVRRVFPNRSPQHVIRALERNGALQRVEGRVLPTARTLRFDPADGVPHGLQALLGLLRTIEYNLGRQGAEHRLFERIARNPEVPDRLVSDFEALARSQLLAVLIRLDAELARLQGDYRPGEPTRPVGVGAYMLAEQTARRRR